MITVAEYGTHESPGGGVSGEPNEANKGRTRRIGCNESLRGKTVTVVWNVLNLRVGVGVGIPRVRRRRHSISETV